MPAIIHKTKGIILRVVKYGETSLILSIYTELYGLQSYLINGVRTASKKGGNKTIFFQPAAILELEVYHNELKQLNRIKEYRWAHIYKNILTDVVKNGIAMYFVELLSKCLKLPENNPDLFAFIEDCFLALDECKDEIMANFPVFYAVQLSNFFGFAPQNKHAQILEHEFLVFDLQDGLFTGSLPEHGYYLERKPALTLAELILVRHPQELLHIQTNADIRRKILDAMETYFALHISDFGRLKTLPVLKEIMR